MPRSEASPPDVNITEDQEPVIRDEEKLLIIERRMFDTDTRRAFVGVVESYDGKLIRIRGYTFAYDDESACFVRRKNTRTRIISMDNSIVAIVLPSDLDIAKLRYETSDTFTETLTNDQGFMMELGEFSFAPS